MTRVPMPEKLQRILFIDDDPHDLELEKGLSRTEELDEFNVRICKSNSLFCSIRNSIIYFLSN